MSTRNYLQNLCNKFGDFMITTSVTSKEGIVSFWKHRSVFECCQSEKGLYFLDNATHRTPFYNEFIIDLDDHPTIQILYHICDELRNLNIKFCAYSTGSKGYHIHCYSEDIKEDKKILILKYGSDRLKISSKSMIALEFVPHWKSGLTKKMLDCYPDSWGEMFCQYLIN